MKQIVLALLAGGLLVSAGVLLERTRSSESAMRRRSTSELLRQAHDPAGAEAAVFMELALRCRQENRLAESLQYARRAQQARPTWHEPFYLEGCVLRQTGRGDDSAKPLRRATELNTRFAPGFLELGLAYNGMGHMKQAVETLRRYVDLEPDDDYGYYWLGACAMSAGQFGVAERSLRQALKLNAERAITHVALGNLILRQQPGADDLDKARAHYQRAAELDPADAQAVALIGTVYYRQRRYLNAASEFERALRIDPAMGEVYYPLGQAYEKLGELEKARRAQRMAEVFATGKEAFVRPGGAPHESKNE